MTWQPIKSAPLDKPVLLTDGKAVHLAELKASWVFSDAPKPVVNHGLNQMAGQLSMMQPRAATFSPTHWHAVPKLPGRLK